MPTSPTFNIPPSRRSTRLLHPDKWDPRIAHNDEEPDILFGDIGFKLGDSDDEFANDGLQELLSYGMKPWEDGAWVCAHRLGV